MPLNEYEETLLEGQELNPYRDTLRQQQQTAETSLRNTGRVASTKTPERQAQVIELSRRTGLPSAVVDRNFAIQKRADAGEIDYAKILEETPKLARYLEDPENAALSKDDHAPLGTLESILHYGGNALKSLGASLYSTNAALWGAFQAPADVLSEWIFQPSGIYAPGQDPLAKLSRVFASQRKATEASAARLRPQGEGNVESGVYSGLESLGQNLLMLPAALMSGGSASAVLLGSMGVTTGGQAYGQAKDQQVSTARALTLALSQGLVEVATERVPVNTLFKGIKDKAGFGKLLLKELGGEIPGEQLATVFQDLNEWAVLPENATKTFRDYLEARPSAAAQTLVATIVGTLGQVGVARVVDRALMPALGENTKQSQTFGRLPDKVRDFIQSAGEEIGAVYVPADIIRSYAQDQKLDPSEFMDQVTAGGGQAYQEALASGEDVAIPIGDYVTKIAATEAAPAFEKVVRLGDPTRMNSQELEALAESLNVESTQQRETDSANSRNNSTESAAKVQEDIVGQMIGTGFTREVVDAYAKLYASFFQTMGERAGVDPFSLYEPYRLRISRPIPEILRAMPGLDTQLDPLIDRLRSGELPSQAEMFGMSLLEFLKDKGGVQDEQGDLASREPDADLKPFQKKLIQEKGLPLDKAREMAAEAGYLDMQSSIADFLDVIEKELRGAPVYTQASANPQAIEQRAILEQLADYLKSRDVDVRNVSNAEIKELLQAAAKETGIDARTGQVFGQSFEEGGQRGRILFDAKRQPFLGPVSIELLEQADLSTFLHETGHFYLEIFGDVVDELRTRPDQLTETQQRMIADYDAALKWMGVESRDKIGVEQHEQWARGFEAHLREGKAPNPEMRSMFARFRSWLVAVYRSLLELKVNLTPEVQGVFDRLLATDAEIERAEQDAQIIAMIDSFGTATRLGLAPDEYALYAKRVEAASNARKESLQQEFLEEYSRYSQDWWHARRADMREVVSQDIQSERVYIALSFLQKGTLPDGSPLPNDIQPAKLDAGELEERYGKASRKPGKGSTVMNKLLELRVYSREGGIGIDLAAELFGYSSGDALVQALVNARPMTALIEAETTRRMDEQYGNMLTDGTAGEKAKAAVMTEGRSEVIEAELQALVKAQRAAQPFIDRGRTLERREGQDARSRGLRNLRTFIPTVKLARSVAESRVRAMPIRTIQPGLYYAAARREGMRAIEAVNAGKFDQAIEAKQKELINVEMYKAATEALTAVNASVVYLRSFDDTKKRQRIGKAGEDYLDQIDALRERFDFAKLTSKQIDRRKTLLAWVADQQAKGLTPEIPSELLNEARRMNYRELPYEELLGLRDAVENIAHLARLKNKLLKSQAKRELDAAVADITTSIDGNAKGPRKRTLELRLPGDRAARAVSSWFAAHRKLSSFIREMDGFKDGGTMWEYILRPINEAANAEAVDNEKATRGLAEIFDRAFAGEESTLYHKTVIPGIQGSLSRMARIVVALNWGNEGNRQRVRDGFGWNDVQVQAILDTLTEKDLTFVKETWAFIHSYWGRISDKQQRVTGVRPEKVEAAPFETRFGTMPGGYYPLKYESRLSARAGANLDADFADSIRQASYVQATTRRGHTEARADKVTEPIRLDFGVIPEHLQQVVHDLTHHEMLIDVSRLLGDKRVQDAIYGHYSDVTYSNIKGAIHDIAWGATPQPDWIRPLNALRQGVVSASLGWNLVTSALQPFQVSNAIVRVGPKWIWRGFRRWARNAASMESTAQWIKERSEFMRTRQNTQFRELNEIRNKIGLDRGKVSGWIHDTLYKMGIAANQMPAIADSYFWLIQKAQQFADIPTWLGAYEKAMAAGDTTEDRAVALADQAVIDSQASGHIKDLAAVERQPLLKLLTTFYSYNNLLLNQTYELVNKRGSVARKSIDALLLLFIPSAIAFFIHKLAGGFGDDDDLAKELARQEMADLFGMMLGFRELSGPITGKPYEGPAGMRYVSTLAKSGIQASQGELDPAFWRSLNQSAGVLFHYPATQVQRTAEGVMSLWSGKSKNPAVLLFGPPKE